MSRHWEVRVGPLTFNQTWALHKKDSAKYGERTELSVASLGTASPTRGASRPEVGASPSFEHERFARTLSAVDRE